jgi:predicted nucleic acid-binding protein
LPIAAVISPEWRKDILQSLRAGTDWFDPTVSVNDCRGPKDSICPECALAAAAKTIVSSDRSRGAVPASFAPQTT